MLDIKSKNSKNFFKNIMIAAAVALVAALVFFAFYPLFEGNADRYYKDGLESDELLEGLYKSNFVLYKELQEKIREAKLGYDSVYLTVEEESANAEEANNGETADNGEEYVAHLKNEFIGLMNEWNANVKSSIGQEMDYCIIDEETGQLIKNTGREIEKIAGEWEDNPYVYYIMLTYDSAGNLEDISAKSNNPDNLIKNAKRVLGDSILASAYRYLGEQDDQKIFYERKAVGATKTTITFSSPRTVTYIYALTKEQKETILGFENNGSMLSTRWEEESAYYSVGVDHTYRMFLMAIGVIAFLLTLWKGYELHKWRGMRVPLELAALGILLLMTTFSASVVGLVNVTNREYLNMLFDRYLPGNLELFYPVIVFVINIAFLFVLFMIWFYLITSLLEVFSIGIRGMIRERSICLGFYRKWSGGLKAILQRWNDEVLHVDLTDKSLRTIKKIVILNAIALVIIATMWLFGWFAIAIYSLILYFIMKKYMGKIQQQYRNLLKLTGSIADGNLHTGFDTDLGVFESYKEELYQIQEGFRKAVDEEVKSQKMKTELITNVSHDLKTPLTAITTYIDLLKEDNITPEQRREYLAVLEKKSLRLKFLIEDLFEVSKANSGNVTMNLVDVDICHLLRQVYLEYEDRAEEADLLYRFRLPEEKIILKLDSQKTYRIFENLYTNIMKYALPHTRVYVDAVKTENGIRIEIKNTSAEELTVAPGELSERFVRGDSARNTEGSGLGLAIAKSFVELQHGKMKIEVDGDLFKVILEW